MARDNNVTRTTSYVVFGIIVIVIIPCQSFPVPSIHKAGSNDVLEYLSQYSYLRDFRDAKVSDISTVETVLQTGLEVFQTKWGLKVTGLLDNETTCLMARPRCGNPDILHPEDLVRRKKRYSIQGSKWTKRTLTYRLLHYPRLDEAPINNIQAYDVIRKAFDFWESASSLAFQPITSGNADIVLSFESGQHGDEYPFDGRRKTLAHAFFPQYGGAVHFDADEEWTAFTINGTDLQHVATHEIGHALGLGHSNNVNAIMAPFYRSYSKEFALSDDDIFAIQYLYGEPDTEDTTGTISYIASNNVPNTIPTTGCDSAEFDAITLHEETGRQVTYAFRGDYYMEISDYGIEPGYPRPISEDWPGLPGHIDAALYYENEYKFTRNQNGEVTQSSLLSASRTFFFKGAWHWCYQERVLVEGYPKLINASWSGIPDSIDAAFVWGGNGETYFIQGHQYYRYTRGVGVSSDYPHPLTLWKGLPIQIDSAFQWSNGITFFFVGENYYRFNDNSFQVDRGYPRSTRYYWLGCEPNASNGQSRIGNIRIR